MEVNDDSTIPPGTRTPDEEVARYQETLENLASRGIRPVGRFKRFQSILRDHRDRKPVDRVLSASVHEPS